MYQFFRHSFDAYNFVMKIFLFFMYVQQLLFCCMTYKRLKEPRKRLIGDFLLYYVQKDYFCYNLAKKKTSFDWPFH